ncbi:MAG TPA: 4Fe-4S dicluster domain-containing protein [Acidimicrobiales bacterium]|jgi:ferredoxin
MPYVITEPCVGCKDGSCVDVCPVDCIQGGEDDPQLYIDPVVCVDCAACTSACPVEAIYEDRKVPERWKDYIRVNADWYAAQEVG